MANKKKVVTKKVVKKIKSVKAVQKIKFLKEFKKAEQERNQRQERFCRLYACDKEFFGNGVETYLEVYGIDRTKPHWYKTACAAASRLLSNVKVFTRINELLEKHGLNDAFVDKQLLFLINQHSDFGSKVAAIREYNKVKQRIVDKVEHKITGIEIVNYNDIKDEKK